MQVATFYPKLGNAKNKKNNLGKFHKLSGQASGDYMKFIYLNCGIKISLEQRPLQINAQLNQL